MEGRIEYQYVESLWSTHESEYTRGTGVRARNVREDGSHDELNREIAKLMVMRIVVAE